VTLGRDPTGDIRRGVDNDQMGDQVGSALGDRCRDHTAERVSQHERRAGNLGRDSSRAEEPPACDKRNPMARIPARTTVIHGSCDFMVIVSSHTAVGADASDSGMSIADEHVAGPGGRIDVRTVGAGSTVVMIASLGRSATDFDESARMLAPHGYRVVAPEPRGVAGSEGLATGLGLGDTATVLGHAFGNRLARMTAAIHGDLLDAIVSWLDVRRSSGQ
jgi:hypothetical protein